MKQPAELHVQHWPSTGPVSVVFCVDGHLQEYLPERRPATPGQPRDAGESGQLY